ncbi:hypothetical protein SCLARK_001291 [Spiroplasma clarkii]|nr:hypothetical protein SCLARK_001291 [Spiroplasma clarkii]
MIDSFKFFCDFNKKDMPPKVIKSGPKIKPFLIKEIYKNDFIKDYQSVKLN